MLLDLGLHELARRGGLALEPAARRSSITDGVRDAALNAI